MMPRSETADGSASVLHGVRVLDFSRVLAGPLSTMYLGDLGADVLKIEPPTGDETRWWAPPTDARGHSTYFTGVNRNKRGITLDLTQPAQLRIAHELAASADVVVENFRPGVMERFGLDYAKLRTVSPALVYCSITGFGSHRGADLPGFDLLVQALGGLMSVTGRPEDPPVKAGVALIDVLTGQNAVIGILSALRECERSGQGQLVEVSLLGSCLAGLANLSSSAAVTGVAPKRLGNAHPSIAPYESFPTATEDIIIAVGNDRQFAALCRVLELDGVAQDPRFSSNERRVGHRAELVMLLRERLVTRPAGAWTEHLSAAGVPSGKVNSIVEAIKLAEDLGLDPTARIEQDGSTWVSISNPVRLSRTPVSYRLAPPVAPDTPQWI